MGVNHISSEKLQNLKWLVQPWVRNARLPSPFIQAWWICLLLRPHKFYSHGQLDSFKDLPFFNPLTYAWLAWYEMSRSMTKPTKSPVHPAKTQISLGVQSDQSLRCVLIEWLRTQGFFMRTTKTDPQADLCLPCPHRSFCWIGHEALKSKLSCDMTKPTKWVCVQRRLRSVCASTQSDQKLRLRSCSSGPKVSSCGQQRLWSDWADAQTDLSLRWAHTHFVAFVMSRLNCFLRCLGLGQVSQLVFTT